MEDAADYWDVEDPMLERKVAPFEEMPHSLKTLPISHPIPESLSEKPPHLGKAIKEKKSKKTNIPYQPQEKSNKKGPLKQNANLANEPNIPPLEHTFPPLTLPKPIGIKLSEPQNFENTDGIQSLETLFMEKTNVQSMIQKLEWEMDNIESPSNSEHLAAPETMNDMNRSTNQAIAGRNKEEKMDTQEDNTLKRKLSQDDPTTSRKVNKVMDKYNPVPIDLLKDNVLHYAHVRNIMRHAQRIRSYVQLHLGQPTQMIGERDSKIYNGYFSDYTGKDELAASVILSMLLLPDNQNELT